MFNYPKYYSYVFFIHAAILMYIDITVLRFKGASIHRNPQLCSALRNFSSGCDVRCHGSGSISESTTTRTTLRCVFDILHVQFTGAYLQILQTTVLEPNVNGLWNRCRLMHKYAQYSSPTGLKAFSRQNMLCGCLCVLDRSRQDKSLGNNSVAFVGEVGGGRACCFSAIMPESANWIQKAVKKGRVWQRLVLRCLKPV